MERADLEILPISRKEFQELKIFRNVSFESLAGYLLGCKTIDVEPGEVIIDPENPKRRLIILLSGLLEVYVTSNGGEFSNNIMPGHCVGEMSIFDNLKPSAIVKVKEKSRILIIPPDISLAMINASHDLCLNFLHLLSQRIRNNNQIVCEELYHIRCIEERSKVDSLTGLHNRRWLEEMYTREMQRSNAGDFSLSAFMLDIDLFKTVNDTYGHLSGDQVLVEIAQEIQAYTRPSDMPVRYGGEEFSVFLPGTTTENAKIIAERIRKAIERKSILLPNGESIQVTISIGIAERVTDDTVESLIERADKALYHAKNNGRNKVCLNVDEDYMLLM
ncbi:MAG: GGDEF domain-containing protein [Fibrobacteraceae bacterium]|nr:GGDEF domain-containing protein [Fibrobacteraceae bacterium]